MSKIHRWLVAGKMIFTMTNEAGVMEVNEVTLNAIVSAETPNVSAHHIGKAQQGLQMHFFKRFEGTDAEIKDVVILNLSYLGEATDEEFRKVPEGMVLQEKLDEAFANARGDTDQSSGAAEPATVSVPESAANDPAAA